MRTLLSIGLAATLGVTACGGSPPSASPDPPPSTAVSTLHALTLEGDADWTLALGDIDRPPVLLGDGSVAVARETSSGHQIQLIDRQGDSQWTHPLDRDTRVVGLLALDATIAAFVDGPHNQSILALDARSGGVLWRHDLPGHTSGGPSASGSLIIVSDQSSNEVLALDAVSGEAIWTAKLPVSPRVPVPAEGTIVVTGTRRIHGLDPESGRQRWSVPTAGDVQSVTSLGTALAVTTFDDVAPGTSLGVFDAATGESAWSLQNPALLEPKRTPYGVVVATQPTSLTTGSVAMVDADTGERVWEAPLRQGTLTIAVLADGDVVLSTAGSTTSEVTMLDGASGEVRWRSTVQGQVVVRPAVDSSYVSVPVITSGGRDGGIVHLARETGEQLWHVRLELPPSHTPLANDSVIIVGSACRRDLTTC